MLPSIVPGYLITVYSSFQGKTCNAPPRSQFRKTEPQTARNFQFYVRLGAGNQKVRGPKNPTSRTIVFPDQSGKNSTSWFQNALFTFSLVTAPIRCLQWYFCSASVYVFTYSTTWLIPYASPSLSLPKFSENTLQ